MNPATILRSRLLPGVSVALLALCLRPGAAMAGKAVGPADAMPLAEAKETVAAATKRLRDRRSTTEDLRAALDDMAEVHAKVGASGRAQRDLRRKVEARLLEALVLFKADRRADGANRWVAVNVHAARRLADTAGVLDAKERRALSARVRRLLEERIEKRWKPAHWNQDHLDATFAALAALNDPASLRWMIAAHIHSDERRVPFLVAAHKAMPAFRDVKGAQRFELVEQMVRRYAGVELVAMKASNVPADAAKKRFWDRVRSTTIPAVQHYAGRPRNAKDEALSTMREFQEWLRDHDRVGRAPWID